MKMFRLLLVDGRDVALNVPHGITLETAFTNAGIWEEEIEHVINDGSID